MHPLFRLVVSERLSHWARAGPAAILALLVSSFLCHGGHSVAALATSCPPGCLCASDIVSCCGRNLSAAPSDIPEYASWLDLGHNGLTAMPADWTAGRPFERLTKLVLGWNAIGQIAPDIFAATPRLRHLDLSFNQLHALNASAFRGLAELEVLLLFGNRIARADPGAFGGLHRLRKVYLSGNQLRSFPLELCLGSSNLSFLDLSSNMLSEVPIQSLLALPDHQQSGVYLQGNPLVCDCALLAMLEFWTLKEYRPLVDFSNDYPCRMTAAGGRLGLNCGVSQSGKMSNALLAGGTHQIEPGDWLQVPCPGLALLPPVQPSGGGEPVIFWITPGEVLHGPSRRDPSHHEGGGGRLTILPDGSLEIRGAVAEDTGVYMCVAARGRPHHPGDSPGEVTLLVGNASVPGGRGGSGGAEHFNTAFTTLASCVVSIVLVLLYLYLTPCRCGRQGGEGGGGGRRRFVGGRALLLCQAADSEDQRGSSNNGKRVAFLEPDRRAAMTTDGEKCEPKTPPPALNLSARGGTEGILKNGIRTVGGALADPAQAV